MSDAIRVQEVDAVDTPPKARVEDVRETPVETFARKRDYLEGFLKQTPKADAPGAVGGELYEGVVAALKDIFMTLA
jgi:hypothetical protein